MRSKGWCVGAALLVGIGAASTVPVARGAEPDPVADEAREQFVHGTALARRGEWLEALAAFERSAARRSHPVTTYNIGYCERALGRYTRARMRFSQALADDARGTAGQMPDAMREHAAAYREEAERRLARVVVTLDGAGARIAVDGRPLEAEPRSGGVPLLIAGTRDHGRAEAPPAATFELWADPGQHVFVVSRDGAADAVTTHDLAAASTSVLRLTASIAIATAGARDTAQTPEADPDDLGRTAPILAFGAGATGIVVMSIGGAAMMRIKNRLDEVCGPDGQTCPPGTETDQRAVNHYAAVLGVGLGIGAAGVLAGTLILVLRDDSARATGTPVGSAVRPWVGDEAIGLQASF